MSTTAQTSRIEQWRRDVAATAEPVVIRSDDQSFRRGVPAPVQVHVDDGLSVKTSALPRTVRDSRSSTRAERPRTVARRASSYDGEYSRTTRRRSPTRTTTASRAVTGRSSGYPTVDRYEKYEPLSSRSKPPPSSIWRSLLPSSGSSRSRTVTYDKPRMRTISPEYVSRRAEPEVIVYSARPKSVYAAQPKEYVVSRSGTRRESAGLDDRMELLDIRDRFRDEVDRARQWQPRSSKRRDYDRRSLHY